MAPAEIRLDPSFCDSSMIEFTSLRIPASAIKSGDPATVPTHVRWEVPASVRVAIITGIGVLRSGELRSHSVRIMRELWKNMYTVMSTSAVAGSVQRRNSLANVHGSFAQSPSDWTSIV
jgi:hypothetical protein